jgi:endonuclease/exonuclease/phosphatase family metal-dependent hydrolase
MRLPVIRLLAVVLFSFAFLAPVAGQQAGDRVVMESENAAGVPVHPGDGVMEYVRWPNGTVGVVLTVGTTRGWIHVETAAADEGWIVPRYLRVLPPIDEEPPDEGTELPVAVIGSWNLEHFKAGARRGFPENLSGGPTYLPHERDLPLTAGIIRDTLQAAVLVLNEINGRSGSSPPRSDELDKLVEELGAGWDYELASSGGSQRIAILFDGAKVRRTACHEFPIPFERVQNKDISPRDPVACAFVLLRSDGSTANDLVVIGVHLKSKQQLNLNHNAGMARLAAQLAGAFDGSRFGVTELDVVVAGDFNANRYDSRQEDFWAGFGGSRFDMDVLAPEMAEDYPPTRLARVPLRPNSRIDYLLATTVAGGVVEDLVQSAAHVHEELLSSPFEEFRRRVSDHLPVTVRILLEEDDD